MKIVVVVFSLFLLLGGCDEKPLVKQREIFQIRKVGTLSTSEYVVSKVVKWEDKGEWYKVGNRKILLTTKAKVKAGINLNKIKDENIKVSGDKIEVVLPNAKIISFEMDPKFTRTSATEISGFRSDFSQEEKQRVLGAGEVQIRKDMMKLDILYQAQMNAHVFVRDFYKNLGFKEVIVKNETDKGD